MPLYHELPTAPTGRGASGCQMEEGIRGTKRHMSMSDTGQPLTDVGYWRTAWDRTGSTPLQLDPTFDPILGRILPKNAAFRAIEVGCFPGSYLLYLARRFGYSVSGIDFMKGVDLLAKPLRDAGARVDEIIEADFFTFRSDKTYDVVTSFGFVEHFRDLETVVDRHVALVSPGGYLVIEVPHFRGAHYLLRKVLQPAIFDSHNLRAMNPAWYRGYLTGAGLQVLHCDYFQTFYFWISPSVPRRPFERVNRAVNLAGSAIKKGLDLAGLGNIPNRWFSPSIVVVARKPAVSGQELPNR